MNSRYFEERLIEFSTCYYGNIRREAVCESMGLMGDDLQWESILELMASVGRLELL